MAVRSLEHQLAEVRQRRVTRKRLADAIATAIAFALVAVGIGLLGLAAWFCAWGVRTVAGEFEAPSVFKTQPAVLYRP